MMKKIVAMMLCSMLTLTMLTGCGEKGSADENTSDKEVVSNEDADLAKKDVNTDETLDISVTSFYSLYNTTLGIDITSDPLYQYVGEKFNVNLDFWAQEADSSAEKVRTWITTGAMPDMTLYSEFQINEYYNFVDQGLLEPLPEGWKEKWPNVAKLVQVSGIADLLEVDGQTYAIPHSIFGNFLELPYGVSINSIYYRKDWAEQVGMSDLGDDYTISISELREYLEKVADAGLTQNPTLGAGSALMNDMFQCANGVSTQTWEEDENGFVWVPDSEGFTDAIAMEQEWYEAGLLDPDYYNQTDKYYIDQMISEQLAACYYGAQCMVYQEQMEAHMAAFQEDDRETSYNKFGVAALTADDGTVYVNAGYNYWTCTVISPNCDETKVERILDMLDWFAGKEGQISVEMGVPEVHWEYQDDKPVSLLAEGERYVEQESGIFELWGYCGDDIAYSGADPLRDQIAIDSAVAIYDVLLDGVSFTKSDTYEAHVSDLKNVYSVDVDSRITEIVCSGSAVETEWSAFVEENRSLWEPLLNELNETYY